MKIDFHVSKVEPQELYCVLLDHFSHAEGTKFQHPGMQHSLEFILDDAGNIIRIQWSIDFPSSELEEIEKKIQDALLTKHKTKVHQVIAFCDAPITGYYRYSPITRTILRFRKEPLPL